MFVSTLSGVLLETWRNLVCSRGRHDLWWIGFLVFQSSVKSASSFPFRWWQVGEGMFCGSKYVQHKDSKEIMIAQTEFAVKITKVPMSPARKKMRDDLEDKAEIHALRGVSGSISWLAGQTRLDVSCQVSQLQTPTVAQVCASSMVVRRVHQQADLGLKIRQLFFYKS